MGKINALIHRFSAGEVSIAALARVDQERLRLAAEIQENVLPHVIGKGLVRPGTEYLGASASNNPARHIPFIKSISDTALLELTDGKLRIWVNDALVTRQSVTTRVVNGDFSIPDDGSIYGSLGWTLASSTNGVTATVSSNRLELRASAQGSLAYASQQVTVGNVGTEHGITLTVTRGPVIFMVGSTDGGDEYISETSLDEGTHRLTFTPTGSSFYVRIMTRENTRKRVTLCQIDSAGVVEITAPWTAAQLDDIQYDQSGDIVWVAYDGFQTYKIERRSTTSWSLVKYFTADGPFTTTRTREVTLTPSALNGNVTLTSDRSFFKSTHVGALFRLFHEGQATSNQLAAANEYTDVIRVNGIGADRVLSYTITGTWSGTLTLQRSYDGEDTGFIDVSTAITNVSTSLSDALDNEIVWYRWGFKASGYTSGSATITMTFQGGGGRGICRVTSYVSSTQVEAEVLEAFKGTTGTKDWREGDWSDRRGWPSAVAFHDGRLWFGGRDRFWGSVSDSYYSFDTEVEGDSASIQRSVATGGAYNKVNWLLSLQRLILGTEGAESSARSSAFDEPLTPTNLTLKDASTQGVTPVRPVKVDTRAVFIQRSGTRVYQMNYDVNANDYTSSSLVKLNEDIGGDAVTRLTVQRQPETYIWGVRADGQAIVHLWDPGIEEVSAWVRVISDGADGEIEDVVCLPSTTQDRVYLSVKRTINGSTVRYLEKLALHKEAIGSTTNKMADSFVFAAGPVSSVTAAHLANQTGLIGWGTTAGGAKVALTGLSANGSGIVSLGQTLSNVVVGLPYDWRYKSAKLAYGAQGGTALLQKKRVAQLGLLLANAHRDAVSFGADFTTMRKMNRVVGGKPIPANTIHDVYDDMTMPFPGQWDTDSRVCLAGSAPYPCTLLALVVGVETNEQ